MLYQRRDPQIRYGWSRFAWRNAWQDFPDEKPRLNCDQYVHSKITTPNYIAVLYTARASVSHRREAIALGAKRNFRCLCGYPEFIEHSSHGGSNSVVVRVERGRILCAATWSAVPGGSKKRLNGLVYENKEGGDRLEASRAAS